MADGRIPGAVLLVRRDGRAVYHEAYGAAQAFAYGTGQYGAVDGIERLDPPVAMTRETVFDLASVTKVMATTLAVMRLMDQGRLSLDAPVSDYLPDFVGGGRETVTLRHLLTHTSGLPQWVPTYYHATDRDEAYAYVRDLPLGWPVGEDRHYSDLGFMLLGRIVEGVAGRGLDEYVEDELYRPLGLTTIGFRPTPVGDVRNTASTPIPALSDSGEATATRYAATSHGNPYERRMVHDPDFGYRIPGDPDAWEGWRERTLVGEVNDGNAFHAFGGIAGHAGLFSDAADLGAILDLLLGRGEVDGQRFLEEGTVAEFLSPALEGQALGWQLPPFAPPASFGHTGFTGTFVLGVPGDGLAIVLLTNRQNVGVDGETRYPDVSPLQRAVINALTASPGN